MKPILRAITGGLGLLALACMNDAAGIPARVVETVEVLPVAKMLAVGDTMRLLAYPRTAAGEVLGGLPTAWWSDNDEVAGVNANGKVTAKNPGTVRVTAAVGGKTGTTDVTVVEGPLHVSAIELVGLPAELVRGQEVHIEAVLRSADGAAIGGRPVTWRSTDGRTATVDSYMHSPFALVTAQGVGQATITAEAEGRSASVVVRVKAPGEAS